MKIGGWDLDQSVLVVAEIGNNHEGDLGRAREMVAAAAEAGAGAVKVQVIRPEHLVTPDQTERLALLRSFQLDFAQFEELAGLAHERGLLFLATPFDLGAARFVCGLADAVKIASGDVTFLPLIGEAARGAKPLILSTGMADLEEVRRAASVAREVWDGLGMDPGLAVLHCVVSYPTPEEEANLAAIAALARELDCTAGYSDHTLGIEAAALSVAAGARIIEKHFTLDKGLSDYRDHQLSADPAELAELVERVRRAERLLGDGGIACQACEAGNLGPVRRSICAARDLKAGEVLAWEDLAWLRPAGGMAPGEEPALLGRRLLRDMEKGEALAREFVEV